MGWRCGGGRKAWSMSRLLLKTELTCPIQVRELTRLSWIPLRTGWGPEIPGERFPAADWIQDPSAQERGLPWRYVLWEYAARRWELKPSKWKWPPPPTRERIQNERRPWLEPTDIPQATQQAKGEQQERETSQNTTGEVMPREKQGPTAWNAAWGVDPGKEQLKNVCSSEQVSGHWRTYGDWFQPSDWEREQDGSGLRKRNKEHTPSFGEL